MQTPPVEVYLGLGSNLGDRAAWLRRAVEALTALGESKVERISHLYETRPWGLIHQPDFYNLALRLTTTLSAVELLRRTQAIERRLGRVRTVRWGPRTVDIDLLVYDDLTVETPELTLPHPRMLERAFVLVPLAEIAPDLVIQGRPVREHLARLGDVSGRVRRVGPLALTPGAPPPGPPGISPPGPSP